MRSRRMVWRKKNRPKPAMQKRGNGNGGKKRGNGNGKGGPPVTGGTVVSASKRQQDGFIHGVTIAKPQVVKQINTMNQADWSERTDAITSFSLYGETGPIPDDYIDVTDIDFIVDLGASVRYILGATTKTTSVFDPREDFISMILPAVPLEYLLPGVTVRLIQVVCLRLGKFLTIAGFERLLQPGYGVFGNMGPNIQLSSGGKYACRYRFYRTELVAPMYFTAPTFPVAFPADPDILPMQVWERKWKIQVPVQDAFDRVGLAQEPIPASYTLSFVPTYPYSLSFTFNPLLINPGDILVGYATVYDPNSVREMCRPLVGTFAPDRRTVLLAQVTLGEITIRCRQRCRIYIRFEQLVAGLRERETWKNLRSATRISLPGYVATGF